MIDEAALPIVSGYPDLAYLRAALERNGQKLGVADVDQAPLSGGRSGTGVHRLVAGDRSYVVKIASKPSWISEGIGEPERGEALLWLRGVTQSLPAPLSCPTFDIAFNSERAEYWMLMQDVAQGIRPRGAFLESDTRALFRAVAHLHARYWNRDEELASLPLASLRGTTTVFAEPMLLVAGRAPQSAAWVHGAVERFAVVRQLLPIFLDVLDPRDADFYLALAAEREAWLKPLDDMPKTLIHGDLRRANISFDSERISLFDWELASRGSSAADLQWHWFLQYWAYPSPGARDPEDQSPIVDEYLAQVTALSGESIDRARFQTALDLCFLRVMVQLGFCLIDPLTGPHDANDIARVKTTCRRAMDLARRIFGSHGG